MRGWLLALAHLFLVLPSCLSVNKTGITRMDLIDPTTALQTASRTSSEPSAAQKIASLKKGAEAAQTILLRYPDYSKTPREYLAGISELLASFPEDMLRTMCDKRIGISAKCKFLPTHADIIEYADALEAKRHATRDIRQGRVPVPIGTGAPVIPFPALWKAFADERQLLQRTFDCLCDASRAFATTGKEAAREILVKGKQL